MKDSAVCRFCAADLDTTFVDLGMSPPCESYVAADRLNSMEPFYPLHVWVCTRCYLVQLEEYVTPKEIFSEYAYFSSYSSSWLDHARSYTEGMIERFGFGPESLVVELASNDGYLLRWFVERGIPVLGVEPAKNVAAVAIDLGIPTVVDFFGRRLADALAAEGRSANLIVGNNVLAQVPDLHDFVGGTSTLLAPDGVVTMEFPHLLRLIEQNQFDTIYHEHFSYFSLRVTREIFAAHGLDIVDVDELPTHGGSLRIYARHQGSSGGPSPDVLWVLEEEEHAGLFQLDRLSGFQEKVEQTKWDLVEFLIDARRRGASVAGYGAPGKGNTLLNYAGIKPDLLPYTVDRNPYKQGMFLPGTHIPVFPPEHIDQTRPDYILILPWNFQDEIRDQMAHIADWGGRFVVPIPRLEVFG